MAYYHGDAEFELVKLLDANLAARELRKVDYHSYLAEFKLGDKCSGKTLNVELDRNLLSPQMAYCHGDAECKIVRLLDANLAARELRKVDYHGYLAEFKLGDKCSEKTFNAEVDQNLLSPQMAYCHGDAECKLVRLFDANLAARELREVEYHGDLAEFKLGDKCSENTFNAEVISAYCMDLCSPSPLLVAQLQNPELLDNPSKLQQLPVFVKAAKTICVYIELSEGVNSLKMKIAQATGTPATQQRLSFAGKPLLEERPLGEYGIKRSSTIFMSHRLFGGSQDGEDGIPFPGSELDKFLELHLLWWEIKELIDERYKWWKELKENEFWTDAMIKKERLRDMPFWHKLCNLIANPMEAFANTMSVSSSAHTVLSKREVNAFRVLKLHGRWVGNRLKAPETLEDQTKYEIVKEASYFDVEIQFV